MENLELKLKERLEKARATKYFKRTGSKGNYKYWYKDPKTGKLTTNKPVKQKRVATTSSEFNDKKDNKGNQKEKEFIATMTFSSDTGLFKHYLNTPIKNIQDYAYGSYTNSFNKEDVNSIIKKLNNKSPDYILYKENEKLKASSITVYIKSPKYGNIRIGEYQISR